MTSEKGHGVPVINMHVLDYPAWSLVSWGLPCRKAWGA
jgi:hypothetical protein